MAILSGKSPWGREIFFHREIDSTNSELIRLARSGAPEGTVVTAESQTAGRGRRGRRWHSPAGGGLWMSLLLRPPRSLPLPGGLSLAAGLACARAIQDRFGIVPELKWPNDLLVAGKKVGGILVEAGDGEGGCFAVIGIGINLAIARFPDELRDTAVSLAAAGAGAREDLRRGILEHIYELYRLAVSAGSPAPLMEEYRSISATLGRRVLVLTPSGDWAGLALDVNSRGELVVEGEDGVRRELNSGEVSLRA